MIICIENIDESIKTGESFRQQNRSIQNGGSAHGHQHLYFIDTEGTFWAFSKQKNLCYLRVASLG
jgi:hypothetical protein